MTLFTPLATGYEYDVHGNLIQFDDGQGTVVKYQYYGDTGLESEVSTYASGSPTPTTDICYAYDAFGELNQVSVFYLNGVHFLTPIATGYTYDADGELTKTINANGTVEARGYDDLGRLTSVVTTNAGLTLASFAYTYDKAGHRTKETDLGGRSVTYGYDALYRLKQESIVDPSAGNRTIAYTYDPAGNRLTKADTGAATGQQSLTYAYDADDRLSTVTGTAGYSLTYTYDANGSTTQVVGAGGGASSTYAWDLEGRMITETTGGVNTAYTYDDAGNRTSSTTGGVATTFINDPNQAFDQVLEEYSGSMRAATYIRGLDLLFEDRSGAKSYYVKDGLDSTRALTNQKGSVTDTYTYDAFGTTIGSTGTTPNSYLFTGQQFDSNAQEYYLRARYYDTHAGRFTSRDTYTGNISQPLTINGYAYAAADPIDNVDYSGHDFSLVGLGVSSGIGATIGGLQAWSSGNSVGQGILVGAIGGAIGYSSFSLLLGPLSSLTNATFGLYLTAFTSGVLTGGGTRGLDSWASGNGGDDILWDTLEGSIIGGASGLGFGAAFQFFSSIIPKASAQVGDNVQFQRIAGQIRTLVRRLAGFTDEGTPLIIDNDSSRYGMAEALRARGYNVRTVSEIFGDQRVGTDDAVIKSLAEDLGGRVLTANIKDFGKIIGIQIDKRATTVDTWIRIINENIKNN